MSDELYIVLIETAPFTKEYVAVQAMMSQEELDIARKERPDLIFTIQQAEVEEVKAIPDKPLREDQGISINGMTLPYDLDDRIRRVLDS
jgi:hypothetical protein